METLISCDVSKFDLSTRGQTPIYLPIKDKGFIHEYVRYMEMMPSAHFTHLTFSAVHFKLCAVSKFNSIHTVIVSFSLISPDKTTLIQSS